MELISSFAVNVIASAAWTAIQNFRKEEQARASRSSRQAAAASHREFQHVRTLLKNNRKSLAIVAADFPEYRSWLKLGAHIPLLCKDSWIPSTPIALQPPGEGLSDDSDRFRTVLIDEASEDYIAGKDGCRDPVKETRTFMPENKDGTFMVDYVDAIESVEGEKPGAWTNGPSYRFMGADIEDGCLTLRFMPGKYFDYQRSCEVLCYEIAYFAWSERYTRDELRRCARLRDATGEWSDFSKKHSVAGINNLMLIRSNNDVRFLMMQRGIGQPVGGEDKAESKAGAVASAMGAIHVIPAGEFQPSARTPVPMRDECTVYLTLLREFAEELLNMPEAKTQGYSAIDFERKRPFDQMLAAARALRPTWQTYFLGVAVDPLSLKTEIMTATVIEKAMFDAILGGPIPAANSEGAIHAYAEGGIELTDRNLNLYITDEATLPAAMGCLELVKRHKNLLL
jgi:hypothetical protein